MSHLHLREDKTCLNCGSIVPERYCSHCGQENTDPKESFSHLIGHFFADVTHYDSQVLSTLKDLLFKPGFLTLQYTAGKRASYLNPIRMYIFISAIFFLVAFSQKKEDENTNVVNPPTKEINSYKQHLADSLRQVSRADKLASKNDSITKVIYTSLAKNLDTIKKNNIKDATANAYFSDKGVITFKLYQNKYNSIKQYDSIESKLPESKREGFVMRHIFLKSIRLIKEKGHTGALIIQQDVAHDIPKIMFVLLPLFALFVGIFYSYKKYLYTQHIIFSLHFHSFMFAAFLVAGLANRIFTTDKTLMIVSALTLVIIFIYLVIALHRVYPQAWWLSFLKAIAVSFLYTISVIVSLFLIMIAVFVFL